MNWDFLQIAIALANGQKIALGPYFLAFLYREIYEAIKPLDKWENKIVIDFGCGVLWFLQLCLQFYFPALCRTSFLFVSFSQATSYG